MVEQVININTTKREEELLATIAALQSENKFLKERILYLERRLGLNSKASSKPPASDGLNTQTRKPISLRGAGKPKDGQKLHTGKTMEQVPNPDQIVTHVVEACSQCGNDLRQETSCWQDQHKSR